MKKLIPILFLLGAAASANAATFPPLERKSVLEAPLPAANPPVRLVRGASIHFAPGQPTGVHLHPASTVGVVTEGSFLFQPDGEPSRVLHTGDSFFEPAGHKIVHFDNASASEPAAITVFYLTDTTDRALIQKLGDK
jgi:quercetin dioxygenase-like cupin family protein